MQQYKYVNPMAPTMSVYSACRQVIGNLPIKWPHVIRMRSILNSDIHEYTRKGDPEGPERAMIADLVALIDEIPKHERTKLQYVRQLQVIIIEYMTFMKEADHLIIPKANMKSMDFSRGGAQVSHSHDKDDIEVDVTKRRK